MKNKKRKKVEEKPAKQKRKKRKPDKEGSAFLQRYIWRTTRKKKVSIDILKK